MSKMPSMKDMFKDLIAHGKKEVEGRQRAFDELPDETKSDIKPIHEFCQERDKKVMDDLKRFLNLEE